MQPRIVDLAEKKLIGLRMQMSFADYRVAELWRSFGPRRKEITNALNDDLISMVVYAPTHFLDFKPTNTFERWAAVEVAHFNHVPPGMETFDLKAGLYAVFDYKGSSADPSIFEYIFNTWLPSSRYKLDHRPHFEVLGQNYKATDPDSEEEIWIPVRER